MRKNKNSYYPKTINLENDHVLEGLVIRKKRKKKGKKERRNIISVNGRLYKERKEEKQCEIPEIMEINFLKDGRYKEIERIIRGNPRDIITNLSEYVKRGELLLRPFNTDEAEILRTFYETTSNNPEWRKIYPKIKVRSKDLIRKNIETIQDFLDFINKNTSRDIFRIIRPNFDLENFNDIEILLNILTFYYKFNLFNFENPGKLEKFCIKYKIRFTTYEKFLFWATSCLEDISKQKESTIALWNFTKYVYESFYFIYNGSFKLYNLDINVGESLSSRLLDNWNFISYDIDAKRQGEFHASNAPFNGKNIVLFIGIRVGEIDYDEFLKDVKNLIMDVEKNKYEKSLASVNFTSFDIMKDNLIEREEEGNERTETRDNRSGDAKEAEGAGGEKQGSDLSEQGADESHPGEV